MLHKLHDSVDILHDLAKRTKIPEIQQYADRQILQRKIFNQELRLDLSSATNEPLDGIVPGLFRRLSKDVKSLLPNAESNMLEEVEAGETSLRATYLGALEGTSASPDLRDKLHRQQALVARAQAEITFSDRPRPPRPRWPLSLATAPATLKQFVASVILPRPAQNTTRSRCMGL